MLNNNSLQIIFVSLNYKLYSIMTSFVIDLLSAFNNLRMKSHFKFGDSNFMNLLINELSQMCFRQNENC